MSKKLKGALVSVVIALLGLATYTVTTYGPTLIDVLIGKEDSNGEVIVHEGNDDGRERNPVISFIVPIHGKPHTKVGIMGFNFIKDTEAYETSGEYQGEVLFHTTRARYAFIVEKGQRIITEVPLGATSGLV